MIIWIELEACADMRGYLEACVDYIEAHLEAALSLDDISRAIGFSKYYLNTIFSTYTGMSIMQYYRKRRLYQGLKAYCAGVRLAQVSEDLAYSSERAFSRAVVNEYGHSPTYFKAKGLPVSYRLQVRDLSQVVAIDPLQRKDRNQMYNYLSDVDYVVLPAMTVLSGVAYGSEPEEAIMGLMHRLVSEMDLGVARNFGFDVPVEGDQDVMDYRGYEYWLELKGDCPDRLEFEGTEFVKKTIPSYRYATLAIEDPFIAPFERIPGGWKALTAWLETRDFKDNPQGPHRFAQCLEEVVEDPTSKKTVMHLYVPVA